MHIVSVQFAIKQNNFIFFEQQSAIFEKKVADKGNLCYNVLVTRTERAFRVSVRRYIL